jgi:hypothetical protein
VAWKADNTQAANQAAVYGVATVDGAAAAADVQGVTLVTVSGSAATSVGSGNPLPSSVMAIPAAADTTDAVAAATQIAKVKSGLADVVPARAFSAVAASATNSVLKAPTAAKILYVLSLVVQWGATPSTVTLNSWDGTTGTAVSPPLLQAASTPLVLPFNQAGWFATASGAGLSVTTGAGSTTNVHVVYALA